MSRARDDDGGALTASLAPHKWCVPPASGMKRRRLMEAIGDPWDCGVVLLVAPAGSGKTTLLSQVAASLDAPVAWYGAEASDRDRYRTLRYLSASLNSAVGDLGADFSSVEEAAAVIDGYPGRLVLVLDDFHLLQGSPAERTVARLINLRPSNLAVLIASRTYPDINVSRLRLECGLVELDADALRFRTWEAELLFRDLYEMPLQPEALARLTRKLDGWAAGLHFFFLASRGLTKREIQQRLEVLGGSSKLVREYLTDNVVREVPDRLSRFMIATSPLGGLTARLCDEFLGTAGSAKLLREVQRRQLFSSVSDRGVCRYHEVLRSHLDALFVHETGEQAARDRYTAAGALLEQAEASADALGAYLRAEDWDAVHRMLAADGPLLTHSNGCWVDLVPSYMAANDPWLLLGSARRHRLAGRWRAAMDLYAQAEHAFGTRTEMNLCASERRALAPWLDKPMLPLAGWHGVLRAATQRANPAGVEDLDPQTPHHDLVRGLVALLRGEVRAARRLLSAAADDPGCSDLMSAGAQLGYAVAGLLEGEGASTQAVERAVERSEALGAEWLTWMGRAALALSDNEEAGQTVAAVRERFAAQGDPWGEALSGLLAGLGALRADRVVGEEIKRSTELFHSLGATTLEAWCWCVRAYAEHLGRSPEAPSTARKAESIARSAQVEGPLYLVHEALSAAEPQRAHLHLKLAAQIRQRTGLEICSPVGKGSTAPPNRSVLSIRCFGGLRIGVQGEPLDLSLIKPRARQLLRLLCIRAPDPVHREVIADALWPDVPGESARRNLQVAVHGVRRLLTNIGPPSARVVLIRDGESYRLRIPSDSRVDLWEFEHLLADGKRARAGGDLQQATSAFEQALDLYSGDLLPEDGPAEWVVMERELYRAKTVQAAQSLAQIYLDGGQVELAVQACEKGLTIDRYQDDLWRVLLTAHRRTGNHATAARVRRRYAAMLEELELVEKPAI